MLGTVCPVFEFTQVPCANALWPRLFTAKIKTTLSTKRVRSMRGDFERERITIPPEAAVQTSPDCERTAGARSTFSFPIIIGPLDFLLV